ncbi:Uma2 family endonuclease [Actinoplanes sp. LDG1-06]|uniref:Uma2 family endonuclease n=1 Tax=Paractinoplanes ovalisporus TaxID=2810368 RepID=A0ABS2AQY6_9ACTN|nr:Uma2 family endonuclease [Actinoplanes ovalisporus]MBM2622231.1 Uma2 family endonuclease [Actinoplanes ovalisporus]
MTAEPAGHVMWSPDPLRQRLADHTVEDVLALPDDAPRVELSDGVMIVVPSPTYDHQDIVGLLWHWLRQRTPEGLRASMATGVALSLDTTFEPDVLLVDAEVEGKRHYSKAHKVVLVVEVVSPGTKRRDRLEKPAEYAAAGIRHYWRVEQEPIHVFAYDLVGDRYELVADSDIELVLSAPFEIKLPIGDITP